MTPANIRYLKRQREAAMAFSPPPDFPGAGDVGELGFIGQHEWSHVSPAGLQAMGMGSHAWQASATMSEGEKAVIYGANNSLFV